MMAICCFIVQISFDDGLRFLSFTQSDGQKALSSHSSESVSPFTNSSKLGASKVNAS